MNWPIRPFSLKARDFSLEAADVILILGADARFMKFTSLDSGMNRGGGEVVATKALKASYKILRRSSGLRSKSGSIPKEGISRKDGSDDPEFDHDANLV